MWLRTTAPLLQCWSHSRDRRCCPAPAVGPLPRGAELVAHGDRSLPCTRDGELARSAGFAHGDRSLPCTRDGELARSAGLALGVGGEAGLGGELASRAELVAHGDRSLPCTRDGELARSAGFAHGDRSLPCTRDGELARGAGLALGVGGEAGLGGELASRAELVAHGDRSLPCTRDGELARGAGLALGVGGEAGLGRDTCQQSRAGRTRRSKSALHPRRRTCPRRRLGTGRRRRGRLWTENLPAEQGLALGVGGEAGLGGNLPAEQRPWHWASEERPVWAENVPAGAVA